MTLNDARRESIHRRGRCGESPRNRARQCVHIVYFFRRLDRVLFRIRLKCFDVNWELSRR